jgi:thiamine biosynthesis lipoprotein
MRRESHLTELGISIKISEIYNRVNYRIATVGNAMFILAVTLGLFNDFISIQAAWLEDPPFEFTSKHMGTTFRIVLYSSDAVSAQKAAQAAFARIAELDACMSDYKQTSELMRLCKQFATQVVEPIPVSDDLFYVLSRASELSRRSVGAFDVTVGPIVQLWRHARRTQELPDPKEFALARQRVGFEKIKLDPKHKTVQLTTPGMLLDLGGIAKGYAADEALKLLKSQFGITRALVAASGDITCGDPPPGQQAWKVDIAPISKKQQPRRLALANAAVSTSGDLEQFVVIGGVRYSHVIDPRTGMGLTGKRSVTVIAPDGITADSMTKAVSVLPADQALKLIDQTPGTAVYIVILDEDDRPIITTSKLFPKFELKDN